MKRTLSFALAAVIVCCFFSTNSILVKADAIETVESVFTNEGEEIKIHYSDIFWGYPKILKTVYIPRYRHETWEALTSIKEEYITTKDYFDAATEHGINIALKSDEWGKYILDNAGVTSSQHNEELDKANILFAEALFQINLDGIDNAVDENKYVGAVVDVAKVVQKIDKAVQDDKDYYSHLTKVELYDYFVGKAFVDLSNYCPRLEPQFQSLQNSLRTTFSEAIDIIGDVEDAVKFAKALAYSIRLQEVQLDLVQDIINTQPTDSTLYKGMVRLNKQLENGFVSYFTSTYITEKVYDKIAGYVSEVVENYIVGKNWISIKSATVATVGLLNMIVFDWVLGVDYSEYSTASVLSHYALDFYDSMVAKAEQIEENCTLTAVKEYETLFNAYIATTEAAFQACEIIAVHNSEYTDAWCRDQQSIYCTEGQYQAYIEEIKNTLLSMTEDERAVFLREPYLLQSGVVKGSTDNPEEGCIYTVKGQEFTGISLYRAVYHYHLNLTIEQDADIVISGDISLGNDAVLQNRGKLKVLGNLKLNGNPDKARFINDGVTIIVGDITEIQTTRFANNSIESNVTDSVLYVGGDINLYRAATYQNDKGKLYLNGKSQQTVNHLIVYNMEVLNSEGIAGSMSIAGRIDLNGNPCDEASYIYASEGAIFDEDSIYPNVVITSGTVTISNKVTFSGLDLYDETSLLVTESGDVTVLGDLRTGVGRSGSGDNVITNNGNITITGNLVLAVRYVQFAAKYYNNGTTTVQGDIITYGDARIRSDVNDSILRVGGDINLDSPYWEFSIDEGVLILNGSEQQKVNIQEISDLYIENKSSAGVSLSTIQVTRLFDHQGNVFTTTSSSTFVDYDGDGLKDNVDPHPTIAESCLNEHSFGDWLIMVKPTPSASGVRERICSKCNTVLTEEIPQIGQLSFKGASLSLQHNLAINYKVDKTLFDDVGYADPYVVFELNGVKTKVASYTVSGDRYVFSFRNIAPNQMNDTIRATLYATYGGVEYASAMREYSVAEYCYSMLDVYAADQYAELRTLLVDLLNYGAASQTYTGYRTDALVNASLTDAQLQWGTSEEPALDTVLDTTHKTVENPTAKWKGAGLHLQEAVAVRLKFTAENIDGLTVKIESGESTWTISSDKFIEEGGVYYVYFTGLDAGQMRQSVYLTICDGDTPVSNTVCYSIGSYAYEKQNSTIVGLPELVKAMMKYGDSAYAYVH